MSRRPLGLALTMPAEQVQSYRVDENGQFVHGAINIGAEGMVIHGGSPATSSMQLSSEELEELKSLRKDTRLEDLEFLEKLGEGNSSEVHRAHDRRLNRDFAVKRIAIYDKSKRHQIIKELHTLYKCDCPHLISFHGAFFKEGAISIALEFMDVGSLSDVLTVVPCIEEPELAYLAKSLLQGLDYLRRKHLVHRDIKPSNICLSSSGQCKLSDFGITTSLDSTLAACNSFVGTSAWMSPERLMGQAYKYPSDVWAIAIVFMECALGKFPYEISGVYLDMMQNIINGPAPSLPKQADGTYGKFSKEFAHFLDCALSKDPEKRSTAEELLMHPWFKKQAQLNPRSPEQMAEWAGKVKAALQAKHKAQQAAGQQGSRDSRMDTSTNGQVIASSSSSSSVDPFSVGYNNTETAGGGAQQGRYNIGGEAASSFYQVKPMQ
jgi:serine/threonine protein kinase